MKNDTLLNELKAAMAEPIKCAVFSGGGAKGAIYSGVHEALSESGVLAGLEAVAGSSAGAISAAAIASGISKEDFQKISQETNFEELLGEGGVTSKDGKPLYQLIKNTVSTNVANYFKYTDVFAACETQLDFIQDQINKTESQKLLVDLKSQQLALQAILDAEGAQLAEMNIRTQERGIVYFKDLELLHIIDPVKFKDLVITATNRETGELTIFDARKTPDVEIALACHASASIPLVFAPVEINGVQYVDGGYRDNIPLKYFKENKIDPENDIEDISDLPDKVKDAKGQGRTLALAFGSDSLDEQANVAIYSAKEKMSNTGAVAKFLMNVVYKFLNKVGGKFKYTDEVDKTYQNLRENALNSVVLDTKDVGTLSFKKAQEKSEYLHVKGYLQTASHFENNYIGQKRDANLARKEFMLKVYEEVQKKGMFARWKDKIIGGTDEKSKELLSFCKNESWQEKNVVEMMEGFIATAATNRRGGKLTNNTATMNKLVEVLNDSKTPNSIKEDYILLLQANIEHGENYDKDKSRNINVAKFQFKASDFDEVIAKQASLSKDWQKTSKSSKVKKSKVVKDILQQERTASMAEKITQEAQTLPKNKSR